MPPQPASRSHFETPFATALPSSLRNLCASALSFSSARPARLPIYNFERDITHVESTLLQVLIPPHLISRRINTYKKTRGRGPSASLQVSQLVTSPHPRTSVSLSVPSVHAGSRATPIRSETFALFRAQRGCGVPPHTNARLPRVSRGNSNLLNRMLHSSLYPDVRRPYTPEAGVVLRSFTFVTSFTSFASACVMRALNAASRSPCREAVKRAPLAAMASAQYDVLRCRTTRQGSPPHALLQSE
jgi:hypothetical protein